MVCWSTTRSLPSFASCENGYTGGKRRNEGKGSIVNCPNCGAENPEYAKFCVSCGKPIDSGDPVQSGSVPKPASQYGVPQPPAMTTSYSVPNTLGYGNDAPQGDCTGTGGRSGESPVPPQPPIANYSTPEQPSSKATTALIFGILAIVFAPSILLGLICGIVAIVIASSAADGPEASRTKAGKITGIIGVALASVFLVFSVVAGVAALQFFGNNPEFRDSINSSQRMTGFGDSFTTRFDAEWADQVEDLISVW